MKLSEKIINIRNDNNLTQEQLAEILFVTRQTVSNWENNKCYPDITTLLLISEKFNISFDDLIRDDKEMIKDIDKKIKDHKYKKIFLIIFILITFLISFYLGYKLFMLNHYSNNYSNEIYEKYFDNLEQITLENNELANHSYFDLNIYIPENIAIYDKHNDFYIGGKKVISFYKYNSAFYEFENTGEYYKNINYNDVFNKIDLYNPVDLIRYFEINYKGKPNILWNNLDIKLTFLMKNYILSETEYGNNYYKRYYWCNDLSGIVTETNYDYKIEIYHEDETYLVIVDKVFFKKEHIENMLNSIHFG